jgi:hypothetical protein
MMPPRSSLGAARAGAALLSPHVTAGGPDARSAGSFGREPVTVRAGLATSTIGRIAGAPDDRSAGV